VAKQTTPRRRVPARTLRGDRKKVAIVDAAISFFGEQGYRGASIAAIADSVDLTVPGLLHHFPSKEELLVAVLEERDRRDAASLESRRQGGMLNSLVSLAEHNAESRAMVKLFTVLVGEASVFEEHPAHQHFVDRYRRIIDEVRGQLELDKGTNEFPKDSDSELVARIVLAAMDGLQIQWLLDPDFDMTSPFRALVEVLLAAPVRSDPASS
jgi:AcrR family transcriptional regulator